MTKKPTIFDPAEGLTSDEAIKAFVAEALASGDVAYIDHALTVVARVKGLTRTATATAWQMMAGQDKTIYQLSAEEHADLDAAEEEIARGGFATDEEVAAVLAPRRA